MCVPVSRMQWPEPGQLNYYGWLHRSFTGRNGRHGIDVVVHPIPRESRSPSGCVGNGLARARGMGGEGPTASKCLGSSNEGSPRTNRSWTAAVGLAIGKRPGWIQRYRRAMTGRDESFGTVIPLGLGRPSPRSPNGWTVSPDQMWKPQQQQPQFQTDAESVTSSPA